MTRARIATTLCGLLPLLMVLSPVLCQAQQKTRISDTLFQADGSRASGTATITWPAFTSPDNFPIAQGTLTINIANGSISVQLIPTTGATPAGTSYTVAYFLSNSVSYTEYWTVPATGPVTLTQVRTTPVPVPTTTFGEHQLALGNGFQTPLGIWRQSAAPVATSEGQCYWDLPSHAIKCTDQTLTFNALGGSDPSRVSKAGDTMSGSLLAANASVALGSTSLPFGAIFQSASGSGSTSANFISNSDGQQLKTFNPTVGGDLNERRAVDWNVIVDGATSNPNFSNQSGLLLSLTSTNGQNDQDGQGKKTYTGILTHGTHYGAGQRFSASNQLTCFGMGDCFETSEFVQMYGGLNASGDEGTGYRTMNLLQGNALAVTTISSSQPATSACNATTTQAIDRNIAAQQVTVSSSMGCNVGDWIVIDRGPRLGQAGVKVEAVKLIAVSPGVLSAVFVKTHLSGAAITPARNLKVDDQYRSGQLRYMVNLSRPAYTTGSISSISGLNVTGSGTQWSSTMVGGDSYLPGCISFAADDYTAFPFSPTNVLRGWYPIVSASTTSLTIAHFGPLGTAGYTGNGPGNGAYTIRPCSQILTFDTNQGGVVLESAAGSWAIGDGVETALSVDGYVSGEFLRIGWYMPGATLGSIYDARNIGAQAFDTAFLADQAMTVPGQSAFSTGLAIAAQTTTPISLSGRSTSGVGINLVTYANDDKAIRWSGNTDAAILADASTGDLLITGSYSSNATAAPTLRMSGSTNKFLGNLTVGLNGGAKIRIEDTTSGLGYEWRTKNQSSIDPAQRGLDLYTDLANRTMVGVSGFGQFGLNSVGPATLSANSNSYTLSYVFETFNGVSSDRRYIHTRAVPSGGISASSNAVAPVEWQVLGTSSINSSIALFAGISTAGVFRFGNPGNGLVSLNASTVTAARSFTLPDASGTAALTTTPGIAGTAPNWTATGGLNVPLASSGGVSAGLLGNSDYLLFSAKENPLTFSTPISRSSNNISCPTCEVTGNKNIASGYAGLTGTGKLTPSQGQKVWAATDLTTYTSTSGSGTTALQTTISAPASGQVLTWSGVDWVNQTVPAPAGHNLLSATHPDTTPASAIRGDIITGQGSTTTWQRLALGMAGRYLRSNGSDLAYSNIAPGGAGSCAANQWVAASNDNAAPTCTQPGFTSLSGSAATAQLPSTVVYNNQNNSYATGIQDFGAANAVLPKSGEPPSPLTGQVWINSGALKYRDNSGAPATQIVEIQSNKNAAGGYAGLTASGVLGATQFPILTGDATTAGASLTVTLPNIVTTGTNTKISYNAKGQVTAGAPAAASDLSNGTSGSGAITLASSPTLTNPIVYQNANGDDTVSGRRKTDTLPSGNLVRFQNAAGNSDLWTVDVSGTLQAGAVPAARVNGNIAGNAGTATALATTPSQCGSNQFAVGIAASGNANCVQPSASNLSNGTSGGGSLVLATSPTITTPTVSGAIGGNLDLGNNAMVVEFANETTTGTANNQLARLTGATSAAVKAATSDTNGIVGIVVAGAGVSGNALIARTGKAPCAFDGSTIAGDYVQISSTVAGDCHDSGSSYPTGGQVLGRVLTTNGSAGTYTISLQSAELSSPRIFVGGFGAISVPSSSTTFGWAGAGNSGYNPTASARQFPLPVGGIARSLYCNTTGPQAPSGSLVVTLRKNGASTALAVTIAASAGVGNYSDLTDSVTFAAGDLVDFQLTNNGATSSAAVGGCTWVLQ